jgi:hypothetical protein
MFIATEARFLSSVLTQTNRLTPDSRQTQTLPYTSKRATLSPFAFLAATVATVRKLFPFFPQGTNGALVQSNATNNGYFFALIMETVRTSETPVYSKENTQFYIPENFNLHTCRRENLKSHIIFRSFYVHPHNFTFTSFRKKTKRANGRICVHFVHFMERIHKKYTRPLVKRPNDRFLN